MKKITKYLLITLFVLANSNLKSQTVGLVLSGGGALGLAHIGVIKALEENGIPIDYITGTSAGAMVGSMYAAGFSPVEMDSLFNTEEYKLLSEGDYVDNLHYFFRDDEADASWINFHFDEDFKFSKAIPLSITNPTALDFEYMSQYSEISAISNYNFDSLFVPFRCVAADIQNKKAYVCKSGHLNQAVRASMTFPGFIAPIKIDGKLMFDGGLYNNFPTNVMYDDFYPDIIIGVNFTDSITPPDEDDLISQIKGMIINRTESTMMCDNGIMIQPDVSISLFDFQNASIPIQEGYDAAMAFMDSIKHSVPRRVNKEDIQNKRNLYRNKIQPMVFDKVIVEGLPQNQAKYIQKALIQKNEEVDINTLKKRYFRLVEDEKIKFIYPIAKKDETSGKYILKLQVTPQKPFSIRFGGVFSSRPINTGYVGFGYSRLGKVGLKLNADSYFGKFYGSVGGYGRLDFNFKTPFYIKPFGYISRFDYFRSFATFFEEAKPSYIVETEQFGGVDLGLPLGSNGKLVATFSTGNVENSYYQTNNFTASDTADKTLFNGQSYSLSYLTNTFDKKIYPSEGYYLKTGVNYFSGIENTTPGSTTSISVPTTNFFHQRLLLHLKAEKYFQFSKKIALGLTVDAKYMVIDDFFDNYTSTVIMAPSFKPVQESYSYFMPQFSADGFVALGIKPVFNINSSFQLRGGLWDFIPTTRILANNFNLPYYSSDPGDIHLIIGSGSLVFSSPLGPVSFTANYYEGQDKPFSFLFNFGYMIYNRRFLK